ncbi:hypothetical protein IQ250_04595 [Pseudanabaenaceae cyanobacterium LEGE 13415]|nr:hypothetical protein [Pseudanabaenaceae cyanobacterium LEGE 13415]
MTASVTNPKFDLAEIQRLAIKVQLLEVELNAELRSEFVENNRASSIEECQAKKKLDLLLLYRLSLQGMAGLMIENDKLTAELEDLKARSIPAKITSPEEAEAVGKRMAKQISDAIKAGFVQGK